MIFHMDAPKQYQGNLLANESETPAEFEHRIRVSLRGLRNGLQPSKRFILGKLPRKLGAVQRRRGQFRQSLEEAVTARYGSVSLTHAAFIAECAFWGGAIALVDYVLRQRWDELTAKDLVAMGQRQAHCMRQARKVIESLGLDQEQSTGLLAQIESRFQASQSGGSE